MKLGNAVVDLPNGKDLAMTTASGSLHIVDTTTTSVRTFVPDLVAGLTETSCTSGIVRIPLLVVIAESAAATTEPTTTTNNNSDDAEVLLIYAVVDQAPGSSSSTLATTTSSRILAVSSRTAQLVWSISLPGVVVGTPVPSYNTFGVLYVVHNVPLVPDDTAADETTTTTTTKTAGVVTVLQFATSDAEQETDGATSLTTTPVVVATLPTVTTGRPFGPPSRVVSTNIYEDNNNKQPQQQQQQQGSGEDVLFLADATMTDNFGALFVVTGSEDKYNFIVASNAIGPSTTAPTVSSKTLQVYLGQAGASLVAWTDGAQMTLLEGGDNGNDANEEINPDGVFFGTPSWGWKVQQNETNLNDRE